MAHLVDDIRPKASPYHGFPTPVRQSANDAGRGIRLDFGATFYFNRCVPANDQVSSPISGGSAHHEVVVFATTRWSVVLAAQGESPGADEALEKLCRTYWWPLYGFVRRQSNSPEEAQDLTQGFFAQLLERRDLDAVRQEKGRLRSYLLTALKHFIANAKRRAMTIKRGEGRALVPLEELLARERAELEPADTLSADRIYERRWASTLLEQVLVAAVPAANIFRAAQATRLPLQKRAAIANRHSAISSQLLTF